MTEEGKVPELRWTRAQWMERLRERREERGPLGIDGAELVRQMRDEAAY